MRLVRDVKRGNTTQMVANVGKIRTMTVEGSKWKP